MSDNNFWGENYQAGRLPIVKIKDKYYFKDARIGEYRTLNMFRSLEDYVPPIPFAQAMLLELEVIELTQEEQDKVFTNHQNSI